MKLKFKEDKWKIKFEHNILVELTFNVKPPHYHTWKCQNPHQLSSFWLAPSLAILNEYHQDQMVAYQRSTSSKDVVFLYLE